MKQCEFCGANMLDDAGFCGKCGRLPSRISKRATRISSLPGFPMDLDSHQNSENEPTISASGKHMVIRNPNGALHPITLVPIPDERSNEQQQRETNEEEEDLLGKRAALFNMGMPLASHEDEESRRAALFGMGLPPDNEENEEEERRRRAALFGLALPFVEELANAPTQGQVPVIQGTPQMAQLPVLPNTPPLQGGPTFGPASAFTPGNSPLLPHPNTPQPLPPLPSPRPIRRPGMPPTRPGVHAPGCLPLAAIFVAAILLILATSFGLGLTVFAPGLALSGSSTVTPGSSLTLHGHNFWPHSSVTLTLDNNTPLYLARQQVPTRLSRQTTSSLASAGLVFYAFAPSQKSNVISTGGDGTFDATIQISTSWTAGKHTVHASESVSHRSASLVFTIAQASPTATATATPTTPAPTATATPSPTAVPPPTLSCVTPGNLALGPISELSSQLASASVTLCTSGTGTLTWQASWNNNQAPWLQINQGSGTIQAPNQAQVTFSASAQQLTAGTYTTTVVFTALESNTTQVVNITLTVKAGCVTAAPQSLSFSGVENTSNPAGAQNVTVANCGMTSDWSAKINNGSKWLSLSSSKGTLKGGGTKTIAVSASNLNAGLKAGTYQDTITVTIGADTAKISVTLVVQPAPTISASPTSVDANVSPCVTNGSSSCTITLTNNSNASALTWSASSNTSGVTVQASSHTIAAGGTEQVTIVVPAGNCGNIITVTFTAPGNTATVTWTCPQIT